MIQGGVIKNTNIIVDPFFNTRPIQDLIGGDIVWTLDQKTGKLDFFPVRDAYEEEAKVFDIVFEDCIITCTKQELSTTIHSINQQHKLKAKKVIDIRPRSEMCTVVYLEVSIVHTFLSECGAIHYHYPV